MPSDTPKADTPPPADKAEPPKTPVDEKAQEEAAEVREESGGYD